MNISQKNIRIFLFLAATISASAQPRAEVWKTYHDPEAMTRELQRLAQAYPKLARLTSLGRSVQNREIWLLTIAKQPVRNQPAVLFDGAMHGSEVVGAESVLAYARFLLEHYQSDSHVRRLVDSATTYLIPMVNPDGVEAGKTARRWKDARKNNHGVNLNRNFDWNWEEAGAEDPAKEDYRGPKPFSEPESRILRDFFASHPVMMYLNCHAGENREPHIVTPLHSKDASRFDAIATVLEERSAFTRTRGALAGGAFNWAYWVGMNPLRTRTARPLAFALEIYSDDTIQPTVRNWWDRYNPSDSDLPGYLERVRNVFLELTQRATSLVR